MEFPQKPGEFELAAIAKTWLSWARARVRTSIRCSWSSPTAEGITRISAPASAWVVEIAGKACSKQICGPSTPAGVETTGSS